MEQKLIGSNKGVTVHRSRGFWREVEVAYLVRDEIYVLPINSNYD